MKVPDLLQLAPYLSIDRRALSESLGLAFLGRELGTELHDALANAVFPTSSWRPEFFADDLFVKNLVERSFTLTMDGRPYPVNTRFLKRSLVNVPTDLETIQFRQQILRELDDNADICRGSEELYRALFDLMSLMKTPGYQANVDVSAFHLDILKQARFVVDLMDEAFASSTTGLRRLHEAARDFKQGKVYSVLAHLLEYESGMAHMKR